MTRARGAGVTLAIALLSIASLAAADGPLPHAATSHVSETPSPAAEKISLAVTGLVSDGNCGVRISIKNQGGALPSNVDHVTYTIQREVTGFATVTHPGFVPSSVARPVQATVPAAQLRAANSTVTVTVPGLLTGYTDTKFTASVEGSNIHDHRAAAAPSSFSQNLKCSGTPPHLVFGVTFDADCTKTISIRNTGGSFSGPAYSTVYGLEITEDGWPYHGAVFESGLATGESTTAHDAIRAYDTVRVALRSYIGIGAIPADPVSVPVPSRCRGPVPVHTIELADVTLDNSCDVVVALKNTGAPFPSGLDIDGLVVGPASSFRLEAPSERTGTPTGGTMIAPSGLHVGPVPAAVTATVYLPNGTKFVKSATLTCKK